MLPGWRRYSPLRGSKPLNAAIQVAAQVRGTGANDLALVLSGLATRLAPRDAWRWLDYAADLLVVGRAAEAAIAYREVLAIDPGNMFALLGVLRVARESGDHEAALAASLAAAEVAPRDVWRWMDVAQELNALGRPLEAEDAYRKISGFQPGECRGVVGAGPFSPRPWRPRGRAERLRCCRRVIAARYLALARCGIGAERTGPRGGGRRSIRPDFGH